MTSSLREDGADDAAPLSGAEALALLRRALGRNAGGSPVPILLAVSGGPDSMALLHLAAMQRAELARDGWLPHVATVDHGLRAASIIEAATVARVCAALGLPHRTLKWAGPKPVSNRQDAARRARYRLLEEAAAVIGAAQILTAHHQDDQIETHCLALERRAGDRGLAGMRVRRALALGTDLVRPFLDVPGRRLRRTAEFSGHPFFDDPSNRDERYDRARVRLAIASAQKDARCEWLRRIASHRSVTDRLDDALSEALGGEGGAEVCELGSLRLPATRLLDLGLDLQAELLGRILVAVGGAEHAPPRAALERLANVVSRPGARARTLGGVRVEPGPVVLFERDYGRTGPAVVAMGEGGRSRLFDGRFYVHWNPEPGSNAAELSECRLVPFGAFGRGSRLERTLPVLVGASGCGTDALPIAVPTVLARKMTETSGRLHIEPRISWRLWADLPRDERP